MKHGVLSLLFALLCACGEEAPSISIQLFAARLAADARQPEYTSWDTVAFAGNARHAAATYRVAAEPLLTEWNIAAFKAATQPDSTLAVTVRLNAYASARMESFSADPANLKQPLGLRIDGRWVNFLPLLNQVRDRFTLYGFTREEVERLQRYLDAR